MNPLLDANHWKDFAAFIVVMVTLLAIFGRWIKREIKDAEATRAKTEAKRDLDHAVKDQARDTRIENIAHKLANTTTRVDGLEHTDTKREIEMVKMRNSIDTIKDTQVRMEKSMETGQARMQKSMETGFERLEVRISENKS